MKRCRRNEPDKECNAVNALTGTLHPRALTPIRHVALPAPNGGACDDGQDQQHPALARKCPSLPGGFGVDIFFITSCFIMVWTTGDAFGALLVIGPLAAWGSPILCEFLIGVMIASVVRARPQAFWRIRLSPMPFVLVGIGVATWLSAINDDAGLGWRPLSWALAAAIVLACLLARDATDDSRIARGLTMLGDSSYSLYLFHTFVIIQTTLVLKKSGLLAHMPWPFYLAGMLTLAVVTGFLFYRFVEQPLSRLLHDRLVPKRRAAMTVA